jgi:hypothetical protein
MKHFRVFSTIILSVCVFLSLISPAFSAESKPDQTQRSREIQRQPSLKPDLSCYFVQELNAGMQLWVQNNTPEESIWFNVHYEAVKDGVKVLDSNFFVTEMSGNYINYIALIPCTPGQKFTGIVDSSENVAETNETNNTCVYNCNNPMIPSDIKPPIDKNINPVIPRDR